MQAGGCYCRFGVRESLYTSLCPPHHSLTDMRLTDQELRSPVRSKDAGRVFPVNRPLRLAGKGPLRLAGKEKSSRPLIYCANGQTLSQRLVRPLPTRPRPNASTEDDTDGAVPDGADEDQDEDEDADEHPHHTSEFIPSQWSATPVSSPSKAKTTNQWQRWTYDVIPMLVPIFMDLLHKTTSLRNTAELKLETRSACMCRKQRHLDVAVIRMTGKSYLKVVFPLNSFDIQLSRTFGSVYAPAVRPPRFF